MDTLKKPDKTDHRFMRSFGRRRGKKLRPGRERLIADILPRMTIDPNRSARSHFEPTIQALWLEIGFGGGEHLAAQAKKNPTVGLIGCEPFIDGVAKLVARINEANIKNIRIHGDDARQIFPCFEDGDVDRLFVLFPDPWPKTRHHKRRIIQTSSLNDFAKLLKDGGELRIASDHMGYVRWILTHIMRHPDFEWLAQRPNDWKIPPSDWIKTRYEEKAQSKGDACVYLRFRRKQRTCSKS